MSYTLPTSQGSVILIRQKFMKKSCHDIDLLRMRQREADFTVCAQLKIRKTLSRF